MLIDICINKNKKREGDTAKQVVEENWEELLTFSKDLIDAKLEDGEKYYFHDWKVGPESALQKIYILVLRYKFSCKFRTYSQSAIGLFDFSERTENCEKSIFDVLKSMMSKLPSADGNLKKKDTNLKSCLNIEQEERR